MFVGNFPYDTTVREVERLMDRYGRVERIDMKTGERPAAQLCNQAVGLTTGSRAAVPRAQHPCS